MDVLFGEKSSAFHNLTDGFDPTSVKQVTDVLSPSSGHSSAQLARELEQDFARLDEISRVLKSRYNDCSALFMLPPECIAVILHFLAAAEPPRWHVRDKKETETGQRSLLLNTLGWIRLGHVCHRLRTTLLNTRALWAAFAFALSPKAVNEMLARAGTVPLTIKLESFDAPSPELLQHIRDHIHNASTISFDSQALYPRACAWPFKAKDLHKESFPFLEELTLNFPLVEVHDQDVYELPPINAPRLRRISMENVFIPCVLSSLESFELVVGFDSPGDSDFPLPITLFHEVLRSLSNVRILTLDNCIPDHMLKGKEDGPTFAFPHLSELCLGGTLSNCQTFWSYLQLPPNTKVELNIEDDTSSLSAQFGLLDTISAHFRSPDCPTITALSVDDDQQDMGERLRLVFASSEPGAVRETWTGPLASDHGFLLDITLSGWVFEGFDDPNPTSPAPFLTLLERIHGMYALKDLKTVELASTVGYSATRWKEALSKYTSVTTFAIDPFPPLQGLWEAICPRSPTKDETLIFPKLETIAIENTLEFEHDIVGFDEDYDMPASWSDFCPGLERRAAAGGGIQRLLFAKFATDDVERAEKLLKDLRAVVPEVVGTVTGAERRPRLGGFI